MTATTAGRLAQIFARCRAENRAALIVYLMAGDPDFPRSLEYFRAALQGGADILEIGVPFSDPIADGPVIQAAAGRALAAGGNLVKTLLLAGDLRDGQTAHGQILMSYVNPLLGLDRLRVTRNFSFLSPVPELESPRDVHLVDVICSLVDGILPVDLDPADDVRCLPARLRNSGLDRITLISDSTPPDRQAALLREARGFAYYIARRGVTGAQQELSADLPEKIRRLQALNEKRTPVAVGFGLSRAEDVAAVARHADGVIVGSALVQMVGDGAPPEALRARVAELRAACARP